LSLSGCVLGVPQSLSSSLSTTNPDEQELMPPAKKSARKSTTKTARRPTAQKATRKATKRSPQRTLTASHKKALAEGRTMSATVDKYLAVINTPKKRGRKVTKAALASRLAEARAQLRTATGVDKVLVAQEVRDLKTRLTQASAGDGVGLKQLEIAFVKIAKQFGDNRGIGYGAWRDAGVPAVVLKRAGVARTRG
jgi:hypothetical protein